MFTPTTIIIAIVVVVALWLILAYNSLVRLRARAREAFSDIDVQLKRRHDLIPNLIETVKGYAKHEREVLENVTEARTRAMQAGNPGERQEAENMLTDTLKSLFAVSENYPDLKASENFKELQRELTDTENKIQAARRFHNAAVRDLNMKIDSFPTNLIASTFGFGKREYFEVEMEEERKNVAVKF